MFACFENQMEIKMKIFKKVEFDDNGVHTKKYYFCGIRYLKQQKFISDAYSFNRIYLFAIEIYSRFKTAVTLCEDGVSIIEIGDISGEGKTGRTAIESLKKSNIKFDNCELTDLYVKCSPHYKTQIVFSTSDFIKNPIYNIVPLLVWEFESGMKQCRKYAFTDIAGVATFSTFCANYFRKIAPQKIPIYVLPYPLDIDVTKLANKNEVRQKYGIKFDDFVFFFNFSYKSSYFRKNPEGTLQAFVQAFPYKPVNTKLVIKTVGACYAPDLVKRLRSKITDFGLDENVILIEEDLTDEQMYSLINCCDVYISLHRGEGLGLGMMEAMAMAKPVIATNYGGNTDFTKPETALMVDYKMIRPKEIDLAAYKNVNLWPEPNVETAAKSMRYLYDYPDKGKQLGQRAQKFVRKNFNSDKFNAAIDKFFTLNNKKG